MIYFHYCQSYKNSATANVDRAVKKTLEEYQYRNSLKGIGKITSFTGGIYVLKIKTPYVEIIIQEQKILSNNEETTVYFIRGFKEGLQDYIEIRDGKWIEYNNLPQKEISDFHQQKESKIKEEINKIPPPDELLNWQNGYKLRVEYDIYESENWVKFAMNSSSSEGMKDDEVKVYRLVILEILKKDKLGKHTLLKERENVQLLTAEYNEVGIIYKKVTINNKILFLLINGANINTQNKYWLEKIEEAKKDDKALLTLNDIGSTALKAYPKFALNDADLWAKIEKNNEMGNLSLLPEQTEFLTNFKFPKYINGQAGSGKSTMLYYLFANAYYYKYAGEITGDIVFLTENEKLLEHTKKSVYDLLLFNPEFELSYEDVAITSVDKHFYSFKNFLLSFLPEDNTEFTTEKYLNFSKFKYLYADSNIAKHIKHKFSAEYVWFAISTYVFGYDLNYQITSKNYTEKMPSKGKEVISLDELKILEKEIIHPFYDKLISDGYWDKIKLIKHLNDNVEILKHYDVIFCDEAQDFSRVELEFILKISSYTKYDLTKVPQFPIVFAGDALQTVNPIGFRTEVLTSMLYNELLNLGFNLTERKPFEPKYNYRSSQTIVNIANAIQFYRKEKLGAEISYPQVSKRPILYQNEHLNVFINYENFTTDEELQRKIEYKTIIVPVNYDEISDYKSQHPVLDKYENIISAVDAKGIDFSEVVIYGFGDFILSKKLGTSYESQFFFNKLYVAITRAQAELVIIDSETSKDSFWKEIITSYIKSSWCKESFQALSKFEDIVVFDSKQVILSSSNIVEEDALRQKEQGIIEKNIPLLQVASSHFIKIGNKKEYYLCFAAMEEIRENWKKAADFYLKKEVGEDGLEKAANAYWNGKIWDGVLRLNNEIKSEKQEIRFFVSKLITESTISIDSLRVLYDKKDLLKKILLTTSWRIEVIDKLITFLDSSGDEEIGYVADILEAISFNYDLKVWKSLGIKYYELKRFESSINAFERIGDEGELFLKSKLEVAKRKNNIEEIIIWLGRLAIETNENKLSISSEIIHYASSNKDSISLCKNIYVNQYVFFAYLFYNPKINEVLTQAIKVEELFYKRELELADRYYTLLKEETINNSIINFLIERWAKNSIEGGVPLSDLNKTYSEIANSKKIKYEPFTEEEINKIPSIPNKIITEFPNHFRNIRIKNFRKFKELNVENLGLFNLVVGDNNIGKTSLLEALLFVPNKQDYLMRMAYAYIERTNIIPEKHKHSNNISVYYNLSKDFICDFYNCNNSSINIEFTITDKRNFWNYTLEFQDKKLLSDKNDTLKFSEEDFTFLNQIPYLNNLKLPFIPYGKGFSSDLAQLYLDEIGTKRKEEADFILRMRKMIDKIERIIPDTKNGRIDVRDGNFQEDVPLHQYGEGANKLFRILLLLTIHKGKKLLIDEIDAGIHHSRFKEFWSIILQIALKDNTQIIATTHNEECIKYFTEVLHELGEEYKHQSRVVQMKIVKDIKVHSYNFESFNLALEDGFEIRGGGNA